MQDQPLDTTVYGIYSILTNDIHRGPMTHQEAMEWMWEAEDDFPGADVWSVWGIWQATPVVHQVKR